MTREDIIGRLREIIRTETSEPNAAIAAETAFIDIPGWDSVTMAASVLAAEESFGVRLRIAELDRLEVVGELADVISGAVA